jgi:hypothetical protein
MYRQSELSERCFKLAAITSAVVVGGAAAYGANRAGKAAKAGSKAAAQANDVQLRMFEQQRADNAPWREAGVNALGRLNAASTGDMSAFQASPDYNFRRSEGMRGIERSAAASGGAFSGNALKALAEFNSATAAGEYGNWWNRQAGLAGVGQNANSETGAAGRNYANQFGHNAQVGADARASGIENRANIIGSGINMLGGIAGYYSQNRPPPKPYGGTGYGGYPWMTPGYGDGSRNV